ncbi:peptidase inhibitor family I36 protein [Paractinoplanes atraurantiacus]|uniref:Peptidase inhibitor family I36 n=1 Tax=Paractinoplanes atraurantiacus TaxID=1036182 RepID=A0A285GQU8_9ACTN|nr:peptidase inhibitor family I36 protein [Actinoplanes atraurantiacus]SNY25917.1 Peptidase inhibitor family I36 [Actinoplanes atraurantiacus]
MRIAKRVGASFAAFGVALAGMTLVAPTSAQAAGASDCKSGQICLFENENFTGGIFRVSGGCDKDLGDNYFSSGTRVVDRTSSIINKTGSVVFVAEFPDPYRKAGYELGVQGNHSFANLRSVKVLNYRNGQFPTINFDNNASAVC